MVSEIKQTWWHIEEIFYPNKGRKVRQVMDIYSNEQYLTISMGHKKFLGFRAYARNVNNKELSYLEGVTKKRSYGVPYRKKPNLRNIYRRKFHIKNKINDDHKIVINLGELNDYPPVHESGQNCEKDSPPLKHVKIELEYIELNPKIEKLEHIKWKNRIFGFFCPRYSGNYSIKGKIQPEFYITVPLGWRIGKVNLFKFDNAKSNDAKEGDYFLLERHYGNEEPEVLECEPPYISILDGRRKYNYLISDLCDDRHYNPNDKKIPTYTCYYIAELSTKIMGISNIPFIFIFLNALIVSSIIFNFFVFDYILNLGFCAGLSYLIVLLAYCYFFTAYVKEGYYIPHNTSFIFAGIWSLLVIFFIFIVALFTRSPELANVIISQLFFF